MGTALAIIRCNHRKNYLSYYGEISMVKEINTVQDLINELKKFPLEMEVRDYCFDKIEEVKIKTWTHDNYPYNLPDKDYVCIE